VLRRDAGSFPIGEAQLVGLFMESVTYGIFLVTFGLCMQALCFEKNSTFVWRRPRDIRWGMLLVAFLMFAFATMDVAFGLRHILQAFISYDGPGGPNQKFSDMSTFLNVIKTVDFVFQTAIGDAILIYRCLIIYNRLWYIIALPAALWALSLASGLVMVWVECTTHHEALLNNPRIKPWLDTLTACTLIVNVLVTSLIVWRIRRVCTNSASAKMNIDRFLRIIRVVLDSGLIYTVCIITFFGTTLAGSNAQYGVSDVVVQVIGITFNLIIIRVNNGTACYGTDSYDDSGEAHARISGPVRFTHTRSSGHITFSTIQAEIDVESEIDQCTTARYSMHKSTESGSSQDV